MNEKIIMTLISYPPIGKLAMRTMKKNAVRPFEKPLRMTVEKQEKALRKKLRILQNKELGKKLGVREKTSIKDLPITNYSFYEPFFVNPSENSLMFSPDKYEKARTSGTSGKEKRFLIPKDYVRKVLIETSFPVQMFSTHDGEKITLDFGDTIYLNTAARPYLSGVMVDIAAGKRQKTPLFKMVPSIDISFEEKVKFFVNNADTIDFAVTQASILVSQILPSLGKKIKLKGIFCQDTAVAEAHFRQITESVGVTPRSSFGSTETLHCSIPSVQYPLGFFMDWRRGFFEFIPIDQAGNEQKEIVGIEDVKTGGIYRFIFTNLEADLTRYDTMNAFKCVARSDDILGIDSPVFKFHSRLDNDISLLNFTRISENELVEAFEENGIPFAEFTTEIEIVEGLEYLVIYIEPQTNEAAEKIAYVIHKSLYAADPSYKDLVDFYKYCPIKIIKLPMGVFGKYLMAKGESGKVKRIGMSDNEISTLLDLARSPDSL